MGFNLKFTNKLWNFIKETVTSLENSFVVQTLPSKESEEDPLQILKKRLALGEITKDEFEEMRSLLE